MTSDEAIRFLKSRQPMPSDFDITDVDGAMYASVLKHFEEQPDERCIALLIGSVSSDTTLGMYEHIRFVLMAHPREKVIPHLSEGLQSGSTGIKYRCCWWAADVNAWELEPLIRPLLQQNDEDVRDAAAAFLELRDDLA